MKVKLTYSEMYVGAMVGILRQIRDLQSGKIGGSGGRNKPADAPDWWQVHIEGALKEQALAQYTGCNWTAVGDQYGNDVGPHEVRSTDLDHGCLLLHDSDADDTPYWLVVGQHGEYRIVGWIWGRDGKRDEYWQDKSGQNRPAYFVPQAALHPPFPGPFDAAPAMMP